MKKQGDQNQNEANFKLIGSVAYDDDTIITLLNGHIPTAGGKKIKVNEVPYGNENQTGSDQSTRYGKKKDVFTSHCDSF